VRPNEPLLDELVERSVDLVVVLASQVAHDHAIVLGHGLGNGRELVRRRRPAGAYSSPVESPNAPASSSFDTSRAIFSSCFGVGLALPPTPLSARTVP